MRNPTDPHRPHRRARRALAKPFVAVGLAGVLAGSLSACSAESPAAIVNGQAISVQQLDQQLADWSADRAYVNTFDSEMLQQAEQAQAQGQQAGVNTVEGAGTGPGVYGMYWTSVELTNLIDGAVFRQYLRRRGEAPSAAQVAVAWATEYAANAELWSELSPADRTAAAQYDAQRAMVDATLTSPANDARFYQSHKSAYWSQICVLTAVDASKQQAESDAVHGLASGARYCLSPEQLLEEPATFRQRVGALAPGQATVAGQSYGYEVVDLISRTLIPYSPRLAGDIEIVAVHGGSQAPPTGDTKAIRLLKAAHVEVNPGYGTWYTSEPAPYAPEVLPVNQNVAVG